MYDARTSAEKTFSFVRVAGESATQQDVFDGELVVSGNRAPHPVLKITRLRNMLVLCRAVAGLPAVEHCLSGFNSTIFAYGQTSSGKTHTMTGDLRSSTQACMHQLTSSGIASPACMSSNSDLGKVLVQVGLAPRIFRHLFNRIREEEQQTVNAMGHWTHQMDGRDKIMQCMAVACDGHSSWRHRGAPYAMQGDRKTQFTCTLTCLELYNEAICDLLAPRTGSNLQMREHADDGVYVEGLTERGILNGALPCKPSLQSSPRCHFIPLIRAPFPGGPSF